MKVLVVFYSRYGHVLTLARAVGEGIESVPGIDLVLRRVKEFEEIEETINQDEFAAAVWKDLGEIPECTQDDLRQADGVVFGSPTRFGNMTAQLKRLLDNAAGLWVKGEMEGKPAGVFTSTATTHGGQETTLLTMLVPLLHLGMPIIGVPYSTPGMLHTEGRGGTPYGATTVAGPKNDLKPKPEDLEIARELGRRVAISTQKLRG